MLIVDAGAAPPPVFSNRAHAGCLAFELSSGLRRIVVTCGAPEAGQTSAREAARTTAAHSTVTVDDTSSCRFAVNAGLGRWLGDQILEGPSEVEAERTEDRSGDQARPVARRISRAIRSAASADPDAERRRHAARRHRCPSGPGDKRKATATAFAVRFHLHPAIKVGADDGGGSIRLDAAGPVGSG